MEFIVCDANMNEIGILPAETKIDIDVGKDNNFQLKIPFQKSEMFADGHLFFCPGTEYGGFMSDPLSDTSNNSLTFEGDTFRGMLNKKVVEPPSGSDYLVLSGDLIECVADLFDDSFGNLFHVSTTSTGITVSNHKVNRYCYLADALDSLLKPKECHLRLSVNNDSNVAYVYVDVVRDESIEEPVEFSQDSNFNFKIKKKTNIYTHMLIAGKGELQERLIWYYSWNNGNPEKVNSIPSGKDVKAYFYENTSYEDEDSLIKELKSKFEEINGTDEQTMTAKKEFEAEVGDYVTGRDYITGITISEQITQKIIKQENKKLTISYSIGA